MSRAILAAAALALAPSLSRAYPNGPPTQRANDPPAAATCRDAGCHSSFALNAGAVSLALLDGVTRQPVTGYAPGAAQPLVLKVTSTQPGRAAWGFELVPLAGASMAGSLAGGFGMQVVPDAGRQYLMHDLDGLGQGQPAGHEWAFTWTPPATDVGPVRFYACTNAANGDTGNLNDYIECATFDLLPPGPPDADGDGLTDAEEAALGTDPQDEDSDDDGALDGADACPLVASASQIDSDGDGLGDPCDVCPGLADPSQADVEADGVGDACDRCVAFPDPGQEDSDADGVGDACDVAWGDVAPRGQPDGAVTIGDAVVALRMAVGLDAPTPDELLRVDVTPATTVPGVPDVVTPSLVLPRQADIGDAVVLLRVSVGLARLTEPR